MTFTLKGRLTIALAAIGLALSQLVPGSASAAESPRVVASIVPVHSLVAGVMDGVAEPELLVPPGTDPGSYNPAEDDQQLLQQADVIFLVGNELSVNLGSPTATADTVPTVVTLGNVPGVTPAVGDVAPVSQGGPAMWLDPENAKTWVTVIGETLAEVDESNAHAYSANAEGMLARLDALQTEIERLVQASGDGSAKIVFDDTLAPFEQAFDIGLLPGYDITGQSADAQINPPDQAGRPLVADVTGQVGKTGPICVVATAGQNGEAARQQASSAGAPTATVDIMGEPTGGDAEGAAQRTGGEAYLGMIRQVAEDIIRCGG